jgi:hypothetical protein
MGQLNPSGAVFLSASVPDPTAEHFIGEGDSSAISSAVSALLYVTLGRRRLVWGGHPAITPMIWALTEAMSIDYGKWVRLYQSRIFEDDFPDETRRFQNVVFTDAVGNNRAASLSLMRTRMIEETEFAAAVFVGGMAGVVDEFQLFRERAPSAAILPIMSTGGAARAVGLLAKADEAFDTNLDYVDLLYQKLEISPNEQRYGTPSEQPLEIERRLIYPGSDR